MRIRIRPHHGMCLQFYEGKGYSAGFTDHTGELLNKLTADPLQTVELWPGTDAVCESCPRNDAGVCADRDKTDRYDEAVLKACGLRAGDRLSWADLLGAVRTKIINAGLRGAICGDCCWNGLCAGKEETSDTDTEKTGPNGERT